MGGLITIILASFIMGVAVGFTIVYLLITYFKDF